MEDWRTVHSDGIGDKLPDFPITKCTTVEHDIIVGNRNSISVLKQRLAMTELEREDDGYQDLIMDENERRKLQSYNINKEMKINTTRVSRWVEGGVP